MPVEAAVSPLPIGIIVATLAIVVAGVAAGGRTQRVISAPASASSRPFATEHLRAANRPRSV
nr:hypothetical protein [Rhodococcus sp. 15-1154-1]